MQEARRGAIPWGLLGMIAMVLGEEMLLHHHRDELAGDFDYGWRLAAKALDRGEARRNPILCFGDSLMQTGIAPPVLTHHLGLEAYNFGTAGSSPAVSYFLLRRALDTGARPRSILVDYYLAYLSSNSRDCEHILPIVGGPREFLDLAWTSRDASFFMSLMARKYLPSYCHRIEIRSDIQTMLRGEAPPERTAQNRSLKRNAAVNHGAMMAFFNRERPFLGEVDYNNPLIFPARWESTPVKTAYVERFFALAARHDIPVFWLLLPNCPKVEARRQERGDEAAYDRFVAGIHERHSNVIVVDGRSGSYPPAAFVDAIHLNWVGAATFSDDVARVIESCLGRGAVRPRRVALPPYRDRPPAVDIEDMRRTNERIASRDRSLKR
jgi:hypothetical protein